MQAEVAYGGLKASEGDLEAAYVIGKADPSPAELYPNKRKDGARRGPRFAGSG